MSEESKSDSRKRKAGALDTKLIELIECPICLEAMRNPVSLPCGHSGCRCCLLMSLIRERLCMTCRAPVAADFSRNMKVNISLRDVVSAAKGEQYHAESMYEGEKRSAPAPAPTLLRNCIRRSAPAPPLLRNCIRRSAPAPAPTFSLSSSAVISMN